MRNGQIERKNLNGRRLKVVKVDFDDGWWPDALDPQVFTNIKDKRRFLFELLYPLSDWSANSLLQSLSLEYDTNVIRDDIDKAIHAAAIFYNVSYKEVYGVEVPMNDLKVTIHHGLWDLVDKVSKSTEGTKLFVGFITENRYVVIE